MLPPTLITAAQRTQPALALQQTLWQGLRGRRLHRPSPIASLARGSNLRRCCKRSQAHGPQLVLRCMSRRWQQEEQEQEQGGQQQEQQVWCTAASRVWRRSLLRQMPS